MKRPRSPGSPNDVPRKRIAMNELTVPFPPPIFFTGGADGVLHPRESVEICSEDNWVVQTRGLCINSPLLTPPSNVGRRDQEREEDIKMDCENPWKPQDSLSTRTNNQSRLYVSRTHDPPLTLMLDPPVPSENLRTPTSSMHSSSSEPATHHSPHNSTPSHVNLQPTTPPQTLDRDDLMDSAMSISCPSPQKHHGAGRSVSSKIRKQKFTMGPRGDCEKCRMGVKGHWMHFD